MYLCVLQWCGRTKFIFVIFTTYSEKKGEPCFILLRYQKANYKTLHLTLGKSPKSPLGSVLSSMFFLHFKLNLQMLATAKPPELASTRKVIVFFNDIRDGKSTYSSQNVPTAIKKNVSFLLTQSS